MESLRSSSFTRTLSIFHQNVETCHSISKESKPPNNTPPHHQPSNNNKMPAMGLFLDISRDLESYTLEDLKVFQDLLHLQVQNLLALPWKSRGQTYVLHKP